MAIGDGAKLGVNSYVALIKETTFGSNPATVATGMSWIEPISFGFKTDIKSEKLDTIGKNRGFAKRVVLDKEVKGSLEQFLHPQESVLLTAVALGGGIVSASLSGAYTHSITAGNFDTSPSSLSFATRKGDTHTWGYTGGRVNTMKISGKVGEPVKATYEFIFKDSTQGVTDIAAFMSISSVLPFVYTGGEFRYTNVEASLTSTVAEKITGFELTFKNNLKADKDARQLGSNLIGVLPPTRREIEFKITQRFDTTTAWNRFIEATQGAVELILTGQSITAAISNQMIIRLPKVFYNSPEPEIGGAKDIIMSEINFDVVVDNPNTSTGKDIGITFINATASY